MTVPLTRQKTSEVERETVLVKTETKVYKNTKTGWDLRRRPRRRKVPTRRSSSPREGFKVPTSQAFESSFRTEVEKTTGTCVGDGKPKNRVLDRWSHPHTLGLLYHSERPPSRTTITPVMVRIQSSGVRKRLPSRP